MQGKQMKLDALIVAPGNHRAVFQGLQSFAAIETPVWAGMLAQFLLQSSFSAELIDQAAMALSASQIAEQCVLLKPRFVVLVVYGHQPSASTQNMTNAILLAESVRAEYPEAKIVFLGGHPSALPRETMAESVADFVVQGEGPLTLEALLSLDDYSESALAKVPGLWFREGSGFRCSGLSPLILGHELHRRLPAVPWERLPMKNYRAHNWHCFDHLEHRQPYAAIYTSLGCPYSCSFCCINAPFGRHTIRYWNDDHIIGQLDVLAQQYGVKNIKFVDEMFVLNEARVEALCKKIIQRGYDFNIWAYARIDTVRNEALLNKMRRAGIRWLCLGIESGSKHVRSGVDKGRFQEADIFAAVKRIQSAGIYVIGNFIFGLPDDTFETMRSTLDMALELDLEFANFYSAMAYPGSKLYEQAREKKLALPEKWQDFSQHSYDCLPLPTETLRSGQVLAFRDEAWKFYFGHARYLGKVKETFGLLIVDHIRSLSSNHLERRYAEAIPSLAP